MFLACAAEAESAWLSLQVGNEWVYGITRHVENRTPDGRHAESRQHGALDARVTATSPGGPEMFVLEGRIHWAGSPVAARAEMPGVDGFTVLTSTRGGAVLEHGVDYGQGMQRHATPMVTVPATLRGGLHWAVGTVEQRGMKIEVAGTLLGLQDAKTPAGTFPRCLKIRYAGPVSGALPSRGGTLPVQGGLYEATSWYARGVGEVLTRESLETRVLTARGIVTTHFEERRSLERYRLARSQPLGAVPAGLR